VSLLTSSPTVCIPLCLLLPLCLPHCASLAASLRVIAKPALVEELDLEAFAADLARGGGREWANYGPAGPLATLEAIKRELRAPYAEVRNSYTSTMCMAHDGAAMRRTQRDA
jgi:hypothetical protein